MDHQFKHQQQIKMFKTIVFVALLSMAFGTPEPKADPKAKPGLVAAAYTSPVIAAPAVAYTSAYSAPFAYSAGYVSPYAAAYSAYSPYAAYSAPLVVV
ncbi:hypothetical protein MTP99_014191 [Tenebrio molitor]|nr:hypothetical protein MTP99_014191 [Tenebrio molitor]